MTKERVQHRSSSRSGAQVLLAERGMAEMSEKFRAMGEQVYVSEDAVKESNKTLS